MPAKADDPLEKITLNLYESDCSFLRSYVGHGWSEYVRQIVHEKCLGMNEYHKRKITLGDLA